MAKDLIIGAFTNYNFEALKPWINSINECGFNGDKVLIAVNSNEEIHNQIRSKGFQVIEVKNNPNQNIRIHMLRFLHIYNYLKEHWKKYRYVISTDVRDVIFQKNPSVWLHNYLNSNFWIKYIAQSEAIRIKDEKWNRENIIKNFGPYFYDSIQNEEVLNVGILAGRSEYIKDLGFHLFQMSINRPDWVADQAAYNVMMHHEPYNHVTYKAKLKDAWALNAHVTNKPDQIQEFRPFLLETPPKMDSSGLVRNEEGEAFTIVHQYDRIPEWTNIINERYGVKTQEEVITYKTL